MLTNTLDFLSILVTPSRYLGLCSLDKVLTMVPGSVTVVVGNFGGVCAGTTLSVLTYFVIDDM